MNKLPALIDSMTLKLSGVVGTKLVAVSDNIDKFDKRVEGEDLKRKDVELKIEEID